MARRGIELEVSTKWRGCFGPHAVAAVGEGRPMDISGMGSIVRRITVQRGGVPLGTDCPPGFSAQVE